MARIRRKAKRTIFVLLTLVILLFGGLFIKGCVLDDIVNKNNNNTTNGNKNNVKEEDKNPIKTYKASLIGTGDGLLHQPVYKAAYNNDTKDYDFSNILLYTKDVISSYDIKYYNQETVFDDEKTYGGYPKFNTPSKFGKDMISTGFNLVSLATNHSMDMGASSAKKSALWWESQSNIIATGMASSQEERDNIKIGNANGITYAMLSYTYGTNGLGKAELAKEPYLVNLFDEETVKKDIESIRDKVDILIVAMHWGNEYNLGVTDTQRSQAKFLADNGVDIVLGTHSHCIEPWEKIGNTVVFYSFGNFLSNQMGAEQAMVRKVGTVGMFGTLDITKTYDTRDKSTKIEISNIGADLNYTYRYYNKNIGKYDYLVIPFSKMESKYLSNYVDIYNEFSSVLKKFDDSINIKSLPSTNTD